MKQKTRKQYLKDDAQALGMQVRIWYPGDGITHFQFFRRNGKDSPVLLGISQAELYLRAYGDGHYDGEQWEKDNQEKTKQADELARYMLAGGDKE